MLSNLPSLEGPLYTAGFLRAYAFEAEVMVFSGPALFLRLPFACLISSPAGAFGFLAATLIKCGFLIAPAAAAASASSLALFSFSFFGVGMGTYVSLY